MVVRLANLARVNMALDRAQPARELLEQALLVAESTLGINHPSTREISQLLLGAK